MSKITRSYIAPSAIQSQEHSAALAGLWTTVKTYPSLWSSSLSSRCYWSQWLWQEWAHHGSRAGRVRLAMLNLIKQEGGLTNNTVLVPAARLSVACRLECSMLPHPLNYSHFQGPDSTHMEDKESLSNYFNSSAESWRDEWRSSCTPFPSFSQKQSSWL